MFQSPPNQKPSRYIPAVPETTGCQCQCSSSPLHSPLLHGCPALSRSGSAGKKWPLSLASKKGERTGHDKTGDFGTVGLLVVQDFDFFGGLLYRSILVPICSMVLEYLPTCATKITRSCRFLYTSTMVRIWGIDHPSHFGVAHLQISSYIPSGNLLQFAIENGHRNSGCVPLKMGGFSIVM